MLPFRSHRRFVSAAGPIQHVGIGYDSTLPTPVITDTVERFAGEGTATGIGEKKLDTHLVSGAFDVALVGLDSGLIVILRCQVKKAVEVR